MENIFAIALFFLTPVIIVSIIFRSDSKQKARIHKERMLALSKGVDPPPFEHSNGGTLHIRARNSGIILISLGIGIFIGLYFIAGWEISLISLILVCLGIGQLLISFLSKKDKYEQKVK